MVARHVQRGIVPARDPARDPERNEPIPLRAHHQQRNPHGALPHLVSPERRLLGGPATVGHQPLANGGTFALGHPVQHEGVDVARTRQEGPGEEQGREISRHAQHHRGGDDADAARRRRRHEHGGAHEVAGGEQLRHQSAQGVAEHDRTLEHTCRLERIVTVRRDGRAPDRVERLVWRMAAERERRRGIPAFGDLREHPLVHPAAREQPMQAEHRRAARAGDVDGVEVKGTDGAWQRAHEVPVSLRSAPGAMAWRAEPACTPGC